MTLCIFKKVLLFQNKMRNYVSKSCCCSESKAGRNCIILLLVQHCKDALLKSNISSIHLVYEQFHSYCIEMKMLNVAILEM